MGARYQLTEGKVSMKRIEMMRLVDSQYSDVIENDNTEALYCEIQYVRDRSSFAGAAFRFLSEENVLIARKYIGKAVKDVNKYEKLYAGYDSDYLDSLKKMFASQERSYGIEILFLVYSDVRSSQQIFEELMQCIDENVNTLKEY